MELYFILQFFVLEIFVYAQLYLQNIPFVYLSYFLNIPKKYPYITYKTLFLQSLSYKFLYFIFFNPIYKHLNSNFFLFFRFSFKKLFDMYKCKYLNYYNYKSLHYADHLYSVQSLVLDYNH